MKFESCPFCGEMTEMVYLKTEDCWVSSKCSHCKKDLSKLNVPVIVEEKPDLKAPEDVVDEL